MKDFGLKTPISVNVTKDTLVKTGVGRLREIFVTSAENKQGIMIIDGLNGGGETIVNSFIPLPNKHYKFGDVLFKTGLWIIISGIVDCEVIYF